MPTLVHAHQAQRMMGMIKKTDKLDARGLDPAGALRDQREWPRTRMVLVHQIHVTVGKYGLPLAPVSDRFGRRGRQLLQAHM